MWNVPLIPKNQLQGVSAGSQIERNFRLTAAKVSVVVVRWQAIEQFVGTILSLAQWCAVDQKVVMSSILFFGTCWCDSHARKAEHHEHWRSYSCAVFNVHKVDACALW